MNTTSDRATFRVHVGTNPKLSERSWTNMGHPVHVGELCWHPASADFASRDKAIVFASALLHAKDASAVWIEEIRDETALAPQEQMP